MSIDRPGYVPNPRYEGSVYQMLDEQWEADMRAEREDNPGKYRRRTQAIDACTREIAARRILTRSPRELIDALAALDETSAFSVMPQHGGSHDR